MDTEDLKKFLIVAETSNLQLASEQLNITPGALSKTIKRIESKLNIQLFDRVGRNIRLNQHGEKFRHYASHLVHEAEQAISEFSGDRNKTLVKMAGPSLLLQHYIPKLTCGLNNEHFDYSLESVWEGRAIAQVNTGQAHLALVTRFALEESSYGEDFSSIHLGTSVFKVVAAVQHPLFKRFPDGKVTVDQLREFGFACPSVSLFCGTKRGGGSDGWRDEKIPRTISYRCSELSVLMSVVNNGTALAYVPDFIADNAGLKVIDVVGCEHICQEHIELIYKPSLAVGWLQRFTRSIAFSEQ